MRPTQLKNHLGEWIPVFQCGACGHLHGSLKYPGKKEDAEKCCRCRSCGEETGNYKCASCDRKETIENLKRAIRILELMSPQDFSDSRGVITVNSWLQTLPEEWRKVL